jgi:hypothetical protein
VLLAAGIFASGWGVSSASAQALPGDALYPVKQGLENASLAFSFSDAGDVALLARFADERLEEVEELVQKGREADLAAGLGEYEKALDRMDAALQRLPAGSGSVELENIQAQLERHADVLITLRAQIPLQAQDALNRMIERSTKSKDLIEQLRRENGPQDLPPGQEKKATEDGGTLSPEDDTPKVSEKTKTPKPTDTDQPTKTPKPTDTEKPTKTPKPTDPEKPTKTPKPTNTDKPTKPPKPTDTLGLAKTPKPIIDK